jgi:hypothetical protein
LQTVQIGECRRSQGPTRHQIELFDLRANVAPGDLVVYFVRTLTPDKTGCAVHPDGRPGAVIAARQATEWTLAREIGHVLGLIDQTDTNRPITCCRPGCRRAGSPISRAPPATVRSIWFRA